MAVSGEIETTIPITHWRHGKDELNDEDPWDFSSRLDITNAFWNVKGPDETFGVDLLDPSLELRLNRKRDSAALYFDTWLADMRGIHTISPRVYFLAEEWPVHPVRLVDRLEKHNHPLLARSFFQRACSLFGSYAIPSRTFDRGVGSSPIQDFTARERLQELEEKVAFLQHQLQGGSLYLRIYNAGAGSFIAAVFSLFVWWFTGFGGPLHPIFAALLIPISVGLIVMAFFARPNWEKQPRSTRTQPKEPK